MTTWIGSYTISRCTNIDPANLMPLQLCGQIFPEQRYKFTLSQSGRAVTGTYELLNEFGRNWCPCAGVYGTLAMSGTAAADGTLTVLATGSLGAGVQGEMTFTVRPATPTALTGTVDASLTFGGVQRATFSGAVTGS
jgi:hypothetical protein